MNIGRNDPCLCGSGRKYKNCCMKKEEADHGRARMGLPAFDLEAEAPEGNAAGNTAGAVMDEVQRLFLIGDEHELESLAG